MDNSGAFDFIIVGAGSAGSCLAARLSEIAEARVLVLEAGPTEAPAELRERVSVPALWPTLLGSDVDWRYQSVPQPALDGRSTNEPRGKLGGGSSNLYLMMHIRGHSSDFDNWAYNGCPGWAYQDVLPYFQKLEDQEDETNPTAGHGGAMRLTNAKLHDPNPTSAAFIEACRELGYPATDDFNGPNMEGVGWHHINVKDGKRHSTAEAYLEPARARKNVTIHDNAQATRLVFSGTRCIGVEYLRKGQPTTVRATHEVILCAGALESPKLLLLSGIGQPTQLDALDIPTIVDLPGVGENFHNHVLSGVICESSQPVPPANLNMSEAALFLKSDPGWIGPDLQIGFVHVPFDIIIGRNQPNSFSILPGLVRPMSRGWIRLASRNPLDKPLVNPNYLAARSDFDRLTKAVAISREIFRTKAFSSWVKRELTPGPDVQSEEALRAFVRKTADSYHHQAGSCKMGSDALSVVDPMLRVHGVEGLRVADASVMPMVPSGNCHAAIVMIAEKCADMLKKTYRPQG